MKNKLMIGFWRYMVNLPSRVWEKEISKAKGKFEAELGFMTDEHRLVHHFVVRELAYAGEPLSSEVVANKLDLPISQVNAILDDLEKHMTFLFRDNHARVVWAYPVTVDKTPHHVTFDTGEELYAA
jgi:hypothetical protein